MNNKKIKLRKQERKLNIYLLILILLGLWLINDIVTASTAVTQFITTTVVPTAHVKQQQKAYIEQADADYVAANSVDNFLIPSENSPKGTAITLTPENASTTTCNDFECEYTYPAVASVMPGIYTMTYNTSLAETVLLLEREDTRQRIRLEGEDGPNQFNNIPIGPKDKLVIKSNEPFSITLTPQDEVVQLDGSPGIYLFGQSIPLGNYQVNSSNPNVRLQSFEVTEDRVLAIVDDQQIEILYSSGDILIIYPDGIYKFMDSYGL